MSGCAQHSVHVLHPKLQARSKANHSAGGRHRRGAAQGAPAGRLMFSRATACISSRWSGATWKQRCCKQVYDGERTAEQASASTPADVMPRPTALVAMVRAHPVFRRGAHLVARRQGHHLAQAAQAGGLEGRHPCRVAPVHEHGHRGGVSGYSRVQGRLQSKHTRSIYTQAHEARTCMPTCACTQLDRIQSIALLPPTSR